MSYQSKLRMSVGFYYPVAILSCYIIAIIEWGIRRWLIHKGMEVTQIPFITYIVCGIFFTGMGIFQWFKYRLWIYPVLGILVGLLCLQLPYTMTTQSFYLKAAYIILLLVLIFFVIFNWTKLYGQERYEINARRLFRLAVEQIRETANGFTDRPFVAGEITGTREQFVGFLRFLEGKFIARTFHEENGLYMAFSLNRSLFSVTTPREVSHICIPENNILNVFITEADYGQYRRTYNFHQLCESMGAVFKRFFDYYKQGLESRIISELKAAR